jgi:signal peptidase I
VNKLVYRFRDINRGEIIVFNGTGLSWQPEVFVPPPRNALDSVRRKISGAIGLGTSGERDFIKRVIGLPGDTVACCDEGGRVTVNGVALNEPYLFNDNREKFERVVPEGHVFVMGDQRGRSSDSRAHGTVPEGKIIGRAFVVIWPPSRFKGLPVPGEIENAGVPEKPPAALAAPTGSLASPPWSVAATPPVLGLLGAVPITLVRRRVRQRLRQRRSARS